MAETNDELRDRVYAEINGFIDFGQKLRNNSELLDGLPREKAREMIRGWAPPEAIPLLDEFPDPKPEDGDVEIPVGLNRVEQA